jgi:hypothetical protein
VPGRPKGPVDVMSLTVKSSEPSAIPRGVEELGGSAGSTN